MMYYLGGYYLVKLRPSPASIRSTELLYTASECFNDSLIEAWAFSNTTDKQTRAAKRDFDLDDDQVTAIRAWAARKYAEMKLGWVNVFVSAEDAQECKETFFPEMQQVIIFALYFDELQAARLQEEFKPDPGQGEIGLIHILSKRIAEIDLEGETLIGYDLIGVEEGGGFHTFHCHDLSLELSEKFGLELNKLGLFDCHDNWTPVLEYLNDDATGCEPVPWFIAKTKIVTQIIGSI